MIQLKFSGLFCFQTGNLTFIASEIKILILQCTIGQDAIALQSPLQILV